VVFLTREWRDQTASRVASEFGLSDSDDYRKQPIAFVRFSRGGKTRALKETSKALRKVLPLDTAIIFVTFNGNTSLVDWEQLDPVGALCCRIAFAARKAVDERPEAEQWAAFRDAFVVTRAAIEHWLGRSPCVLLMDELNYLYRLQDRTFAPAHKLVTLLLDVMLKPAQRIFVFSSHEVRTTSDVARLFSTPSARGVIIQNLPIVTK
jgi:hypothetical protein